MSVPTLLLFFFSALGAFNGLLLSLYFFSKAKMKNNSNFFLGALLLVLSVRILKSVFLFFNPNLSDLFIQVGLSACFLIGPFLYFFVVAFRKDNFNVNHSWTYHIIPLFLIITLTGMFFPYHENLHLWSQIIVRIIYLEWLVYILLAGFELKETLIQVFKRKKIDATEKWLLKVFVGVTIIWLAYVTVPITSYIVGALTFSFVFYLLLVQLATIKKSKSNFLDQKEKYADKKINNSEADHILSKLDATMAEGELFHNANLKIGDVAKQLNVAPHYLSQFLNDNLGKSFSLYVNEYRINAAKSLIVSNENYTLEAIGYECGFNSKSTFFSTFKKITGLTPANYQTLAKTERFS